MTTLNTIIVRRQLPMDCSGGKMNEVAPREDKAEVNSCGCV